MKAAWLGLCACIAIDAQAITADHYELTLKPDFAAQRLEGRSRIRLRADGEPARVIELSAGPHLELARAVLNGNVVTAERIADGWRIGLSEAQASAPLSWLELDYRAVASDGLVFGADHVYTAFHTCDWMPCAGRDLSRASVAIRLDLPAGYRSVTSGPPAVDAATSPPVGSPASSYPLYTFGFAAGRFDEWTDASDPRLRYLGTVEPEAALQTLFKGGAQVLAFLESKAGLPLPHAVYTQVLVAGAAAQEASGFSVIGADVLSPILKDPEEDWVIAHEMAHQWWGNLVTCASWNELWLNEGIAVFMTAAWKQHRWGEAAYRRELDVARRRWQVAVDAGFDKPLAWAGEYPSLRIRRAIQYSKAALFIDAVRQELGETAFWDGLRRYARQNAGRSVQSGDLQAAMEISAGRRLQLLFERWVYR